MEKGEYFLDGRKTKPSGGRKEVARTTSPLIWNVERKDLRAHSIVQRGGEAKVIRLASGGKVRKRASYEVAGYQEKITRGGGYRT